MGLPMSSWRPGWEPRLWRLIAVVVVGLAFFTIVVISVVLFVVAGDESGRVTPEPPKSTDGGAEKLKVEVIDELPHDARLFTQGLEVHNGVVYESAGLVGTSKLRRYEADSGEVLAERVNDPSVFAEGLTVLDDDTAIQLTWEDGKAYRWAGNDLEAAGTFDYEGEGWGLCFDDVLQALVMSDGSSTLTIRNPQTFEVIGQVEVRNGSKPVEELNELECVDGQVYANVWQTDTIVRVDAASGEVTAEIDAAGLLTEDEAADADVLNGIAATRTEGEFLVTGKKWPKMFRVRFVEE